MKLSEKIYYCRKRIGKSQEALAEMLGVSRQAVSKWETGDAEPEINKLQLLAQVFGVTVDWLLSEDGPEPEQNAFCQPAQNAPTPNYPNWLDSLPGFIGKLFKKYGWLFGVYIAAGGAGIAMIGGIAKYISNKMFSSFADPIFGGFGGGFPGGTIIYDEFGNSIGGMDGMISNFAANNPVSVLGTFIMWLGVIMVIVGIILAVLLKKQSKK